MDKTKTLLLIAVVAAGAFWYMHRKSVATQAVAYSQQSVAINQAVPGATAAAEASIIGAAGNAASSWLSGLTN